MKKNFYKKYIIFSLIICVLSCLIVSAAGIYNANEIYYIPEDTSWKVSNVNAAINSLYDIKKELTNLKQIGTATSGNILTGYNALVNGIIVNGSMADNGVLDWNPSSSTTKTITPGYYSGGTISTSNAYNSGYSSGQNNANVKKVSLGTSGVSSSDSATKVAKFSATSIPKYTSLTISNFSAGIISSVSSGDSGCTHAGSSNSISGISYDASSGTVSVSVWLSDDHCSSMNATVECFVFY